ncbi:MAG: hypothetical protein ACYCY0_04550 [Acidithiobacillus ferrivorans]
MSEIHGVYQNSLKVCDELIKALLAHENKSHHGINLSGVSVLEGVTVTEGWFLAAQLQHTENGNLGEY